MSCGISSAFAELFPTEGQVAHVLRTRAPCAHLLYCYRKLRTRLACVKHAASVRSEPGSNSRLNLEAWKIKTPIRIGASHSKQFFCRSIHSVIERVLAHLIQLSKSRPPRQAERLQTNPKYNQDVVSCQPQLAIYPQHQESRLVYPRYFPRTLHLPTQKHPTAEPLPSPRKLRYAPRDANYSWPEARMRPE
jgi:hypothetical protein